LGYVHLFPGGEEFVADADWLEIWNVRSGRAVAKLARRSDFDIVGLAIAADGNTIAASAQGRIVIWRVPDYTRIAELE
jgi:hypothetical protein